MMMNTSKFERNKKGFRDQALVHENINKHFKVLIAFYIVKMCLSIFFINVFINVFNQHKDLLGFATSINFCEYSDSVVCNQLSHR